MSAERRDHPLIAEYGVLYPLSLTLSLPGQGTAYLRRWTAAQVTSLILGVQKTIYLRRNTVALRKNIWKVLTMPFIGITIGHHVANWLISRPTTKPITRPWSETIPWHTINTHGKETWFFDFKTAMDYATAKDPDVYQIMGYVRDEGLYHLYLKDTLFGWVHKTWTDRDERWEEDPFEGVVLLDPVYSPSSGDLLGLKARIPGGHIITDEDEDMSRLIHSYLMR